MADSEFILGLLERVKRRLSALDRLQKTSSVLGIALAIPVCLKVADLIFPLRGLTVAIVLAVWGVATLLWALVRIRGNATMLDAAASLDRIGKLQDQMKSAYWFILHPSSSAWVGSLLDNAEKRGRALQIEALFPAAFPRSAKAALSLCILFVILNFLPLSQNHNWLLLEAAPPFRLSRTDQSLLEHARKLLSNTKAADQLEKIVTELEQGKLSSKEAQRELSTLQQQIDGGNLELNNILDGLSSIANQLGQSAVLESAAQAMAQGNLEKAADDIRDLADKLGVTPADVLRELQRNMAQAASSSPAGLQELSKSMQQASDSLKNNDTQAGKVAMDNLAQALQQLGQKLQDQQRQSQASRQLADLQNALQQETAADSASDAQTAAAPAQGESAGGDSGNPSAGGSAATGNSSGIGKGSRSGNSSGSSGLGSSEDLKPEAATKLDVQLKMEGLKGQPSTGGKLQDIEEASRQERSLMDYRNVPSQLSPAQKDALNQNRLPREQREIVKTYFEEIRPQSSGPAKP